uniref:HTH_48 domain-containing protein n=1 Tax=Heterorhabditis bacteriophora TaxID=37862 RepID=A0A1I7WRN5_HETBA
MGHAPKLSQHERGQIDAPSTRSREVILNFLRHQEKYGTKKSSGRPSDLNGREKRTILHTASNSTTSIVGIRRTCGTDASESTVWTKLNKCPNNVIFGDGKKFSLVGPNGWHSYWSDLSRE